MKRKPQIKHELEYKPRTLNEIAQLKNIKLEVKKGEFLIIIGKIQSGKSSLMKAMIGEMMNIPQREVEFIGSEERQLSYPECRALEHTLLHTDFTNTVSPVEMAGSVSYVEQLGTARNLVPVEGIRPLSSLTARNLVLVEEQ